MNKQAFLSELEERLASLPEDEQARLVDYYREMIDDRVEEGVPEEEAVEALGDVADIAAAFVDAGARATPHGAAETVAALRHLRVRVLDADVTVVREAIEGGAAAQLRFSEPARFTWRMDGDALEVTEKESASRGRSAWHLGLRHSPRVTIALAQDLSGDLAFESAGGNLNVDRVQLGGHAELGSGSGDIGIKSFTCGAGAAVHSHSGDLKLSGLNAAGKLALRTASGDIDAADLSVEGGLALNSASGDIDAANLSVEGDLALSSTSGDIEVRQLTCGELSVSAASGDIEIDRGAAGAAVIRTASGDVRLDELETDPTLSVECASGDVLLTRCIARETRVRTATGDIAFRLAALPCGYDISANAISGDIRLPRNNPAAGPGQVQPRIVARSAAGDIVATIID